MSVFGTATKSILSPYQDEDNDPPEQRREKIDGMVAENRAKTPPAVAEVRRTPRLSIAELNSLDQDQLREVYAKTHNDTRGPLEQVLDVIDLPRNVIANVVSGAIAPEARDTDEVGAFGLPEVHTSDILKSMGVSNRIVAGIAGFVGDVALDPLTYVGAPGGKATMTAVTSGGKVAQTTLRGAGKRAIYKSIADVAKGNAARDELASGVIQAFGYTPETIAAMKAEGKTAKEIEQAIRSTVAGDSRTNLSDLVNNPAKFVVDNGPMKPFEGSRFAYELHRGEGEAAAKVRDFVAKYGDGTEPGLRLGLKEGEVGSAIAHIPGTDLSVTVPSIFGGNSAKRRALWLTKARDFGFADDAVRDPLAADAYLTGKRVSDIHEEQALAAEAQRIREAATSEQLRVARENSPGVPSGMESSTLDDEVDAIEQLAEQQRQVYSSSSALRAQESSERTANLRDALYRAGRAPAGTYTPEQMVRISNLYDQSLIAEARTRTLASQHKTMRGLVENKALEMSELQRHAPDTMIRLWKESPKDAEQVAEMATQSLETAQAYAHQLKGQLLSFLSSDEIAMVDHAKLLLGTDDSSIAASLMQRAGQAIQNKYGADSEVAKKLYAIDEWKNRVFNIRGGSQLNQVAHANAEQRTARVVQEHVRRQVEMDLRRIGSAHGVNDIETLSQLAYAKLYKHADPNGSNFYLTEFGTDKPSLLLQMLENAKAKGILGNAKLDKELDEYAASTVQQIRSLGDEALSEHMLGQLMSGHVPLSASDPARADILERSLKFDVPGIGAGKQPFQTRRTTFQTRFINPETGKWQRFFDMDRHMMNGPDIRNMPIDEVAQRLGTDVDKAKDYVEAYDAMRNYDRFSQEIEGFADLNYARPTDHVELNAEWNKGRFSALTGASKEAAEFFDSNLASVMGQRMAQHQRAMGTKRIMDILKSTGVQVNGKLLNVTSEEFKNGKVTRKINGVEYTLMQGGSGQVLADIGGERYRLLSKDGRSKFNSIFGHYYGKDADLDGLLIPEVLADKIDATIAAGSPGKMPETLAALDDLTSIWRTTTLFHPSWTIADTIGNFWNALSGGAKAEHFVQDGRTVLAIRLAAHDPETAAKYTVSLPTGDIRGDELLKMMSEDHIIEHNLPLEIMGKMIQENPSVLSKPKEWLQKIAGPYFRANQISNDWMRAQTYLSHLRQGQDRTTARMLTLRSMMDWTDFTRVEREYFRRVMPFYSWMRNNVGYQLWNTVNQPAWIAAVPKLHNALETMISGDEKIPETDRPGWMREQLALQLGGKGDDSFGVLFSGLLPTNDILKILAPLAGGTAGALELMHYFGSQVNPVASIPLQLGAGTEFFSGRSIGADDAEGDISAGDFLAGQVRPLSEFGVSGTAGAAIGGTAGLALGGPAGGLVGGLGGALVGSAIFGGGKSGQALERSPGEFLGRAAIGGRLQAMDDARLSSSVQREFRDRETRLRAAINRAERKGDQETSREARARLLRMYEDMAKRGLKIPRWAEGQLAELAAPA